MTKWLVLSLVLIATSMASAALTLRGPSHVLVGEPFQLVVSGLKVDAPQNGSAITGGVYGDLIATSASVLAAASNAYAGTTFLTSYGGWDFIVESPGSLADGDWFIYEFSGVAAGTYTFGLYDYAVDYYLPIQTLTVTCVSESLEPFFSIAPQLFSFSAHEAGSNPIDQPFRITNKGQQTLNWSLSEPDQIPNWLAVTPTSGSLVDGQNELVALSVDIAGLTGGQYSYLLELIDLNALNNPLTIAVDLEVIESVNIGWTVDVTAPATVVEGTQYDVIISGEASSVSGGWGEVGGLYPPDFSAGGLPDTLRVLQAAGNLGNANIVTDYGGFDFLVGDLEPGVLTGDWIVATYTAGPAGDSLVLDLWDYAVSYEIPATPSVAVIQFVSDYPKPYFSISPQSFSFTGYDDGTNPVNQSFTILNAGQQTLEWSVSEPTQLPDWLTIVPINGSLIHDQSEVATLSVDITALVRGQYSYVLEVADPNALNSPQTITIDLEVIGPILDISNTDFDFTAYLDGANPNNRLLTVSNPGGGMLNWLADTTGMPSWLTLSSTSGNLSHNASDELTLSVDITGLADGNYNDSFEVDGPSAENSPQTITVGLEVIGPILDISNTNFNFATDPGGPDPADQILTVSNPGGGLVNWSADYTDAPSWLTISGPDSGSLSHGHSDPITLSASVAGLSEGIYTYTFDVAAPNADGSPDTIEVELNYGNICYTGPDFDEWVAVGRPDSWCDPSQSQGDADGANEAIGKGVFTVGFNDLDILLEGFYKPYSGDPLVDPWIAADFDHASEKIGKEFYRVGFNDLDIWLSNFQTTVSP